MVNSCTVAEIRSARCLALSPFPPAGWGARLFRLVSRSGDGGLVADAHAVLPAHTGEARQNERDQRDPGRVKFTSGYHLDLLVIQRFQKTAEASEVGCVVVFACLVGHHDSVITGHEEVIRAAHDHRNIGARHVGIGIDKGIGDLVAVSAR